MRTYSHFFADYGSLEKWIRLNRFAEQNEVLVQLFCGVAEHDVLLRLTRYLTQILPNAKLMSVTTDGEILDDIISTGKIALSISVFDDTRLTLASTPFVGDSYTMGQCLASFAPPKARLGIVFTAGMGVNGEEFLQGLRSRLTSECVITGGMAGDNGRLRETWIGSGSRLLAEGAVGIFFESDTLAFSGSYHLGWKPIGIPMEVTRSERNRVYEIDGMRARDLYVKYFGEEIAAKLPKSGIAFPLILERGEVRIARACLRLHEDGSISFGGNISQGETVRFGIGDITTILHNNLATTRELYERFEPESVFVYSCAALRRLFRDQSGLEIATIARYSPVCGFFTYGEFFTAEGRFELLNETMTLLSLSERPAADRPRSVSEEFSEGVEGANEIVQAMTHMVNTMAQEWEERLKRETEKNLEHERRISHQNKLAQMGEMVAMIAHQWRQPLNALSATAINLTLKAQMEELHPEDTLRGARFIQNQCQKMSQTIETFMEFVKPSREPRPFELRHSIDAVLVLIERQLYNHNVSVQVEERRTGVVIEGYEDQFEQVLLNLLANARDAFDESDRPDKQLTLIIDSDSRGLALLALEDNAGGIPEPLREKIFNPFFTSKEEGKGTGLGLYMSLEIIRKSFHSDLRYLPREGGSRFEIVFDPSVVRR